MDQESSSRRRSVLKASSSYCVKSMDETCDLTETRRINRRVSFNKRYQVREFNKEVSLDISDTYQRDPHITDTSSDSSSLHGSARDMSTVGSCPSFTGQGLRSARQSMIVAGDAQKENIAPPLDQYGSVMTTDAVLNRSDFVSSLSPTSTPDFLRNVPVLTNTSSFNHSPVAVASDCCEAVRSQVCHTNRLSTSLSAVPFNDLSATMAQKELKIQASTGIERRSMQSVNLFQQPNVSSVVAVDDEAMEKELVVRGGNTVVSPLYPEPGDDMVLDRKSEGKSDSSGMPDDSPQLMLHLSDSSGSDDRSCLDKSLFFGGDLTDITISDYGAGDSMDITVCNTPAKIPPSNSRLSHLDVSPNSDNMPKMSEAGGGIGSILSSETSLHVVPRGDFSSMEFTEVARPCRMQLESNGGDNLQPSIDTFSNSSAVALNNVSSTSRVPSTTVGGQCDEAAAFVESESSKNAAIDGVSMDITNAVASTAVNTPYSSHKVMKQKDSSAVATDGSFIGGFKTTTDYGAVLNNNNNQLQNSMELTEAIPAAVFQTDRNRQSVSAPPCKNSYQLQNDMSMTRNVPAITITETHSVPVPITTQNTSRPQLEISMEVTEAVPVTRFQTGINQQTVPITAQNITRTELQNSMELTEAVPVTRIQTDINQQTVPITAQNITRTELQNSMELTEAVPVTRILTDINQQTVPITAQNITRTELQNSMELTGVVPVVSVRTGVIPESVPTTQNITRPDFQNSMELTEAIPVTRIQTGINQQMFPITAQNITRTELENSMELTEAVPVTRIRTGINQQTVPITAQNITRTELQNSMELTEAVPANIQFGTNQNSVPVTPCNITRPNLENSMELTEAVPVTRIHTDINQDAVPITPQNITRPDLQNSVELTEAIPLARIQTGINQHMVPITAQNITRTEIQNSMDLTEAVPASIQTSTKEDLVPVTTCNITRHNLENSMELTEAVPVTRIQTGVNQQTVPISAQNITRTEFQNSMELTVAVPEVKTGTEMNQESSRLVSCNVTRPQLQNSMEFTGAVPVVRTEVFPESVPTTSQNITRPDLQNSMELTEAIPVTRIQTGINQQMFPTTAQSITRTELENSVELTEAVPVTRIQTGINQQTVPITAQNVTRTEFQNSMELTEAVPANIQTGTNQNSVPVTPCNITRPNLENSMELTETVPVTRIQTGINQQMFPITAQNITRPDLQNSMELTEVIPLARIQTGINQHMVPITSQNITRTEIQNSMDLTVAVPANVQTSTKQDLVPVTTSNITGPDLENSMELTEAVPVRRVQTGANQESAQITGLRKEAPVSIQTVTNQESVQNSVSNSTRSQLQNSMELTEAVPIPRNNNEVDHESVPTTVHNITGSQFQASMDMTEAVPAMKEQTEAVVLTNIKPLDPSDNSTGNNFSTASNYDHRNRNESESSLTMKGSSSALSDPCVAEVESTSQSSKTTENLIVSSDNSGKMDLTEAVSSTNTHSPTNGSVFQGETEVISSTPVQDQPSMEFTQAVPTTEVQATKALECTETNQVIQPLDTSDSVLRNSMELTGAVPTLCTETGKIQRMVQNSCSSSLHTEPRSIMDSTGSLPFTGAQTGSIQESTPINLHGDNESQSTMELTKAAPISESQTKTYDESVQDSPKTMSRPTHSDSQNSMDLTEAIAVHSPVVQSSYKDSSNTSTVTLQCIESEHRNGMDLTEAVPSQHVHTEIGKDPSQSSTHSIPITYVVGSENTENVAIAQSETNQSAVNASSYASNPNSENNMELTESVRSSIYRAQTSEKINQSAIAISMSTTVKNENSAELSNVNPTDGLQSDNEPIQNISKTKVLDTGAKHEEDIHGIRNKLRNTVDTSRMDSEECVLAETPAVDLAGDELADEIISNPLVEMSQNKQSMSVYNLPETSQLQIDFEHIKRDLAFTKESSVDGSKSVSVPVSNTDGAHDSVALEHFRTESISEPLGYSQVIVADNTSMNRISSENGRTMSQTIADRSRDVSGFHEGHARSRSDKLNYSSANVDPVNTTTGSRCSNNKPVSNDSANANLANPTGLTTPHVSASLNSDGVRHVSPNCTVSEMMSTNTVSSSNVNSSGYITPSAANTLESIEDKKDFECVDNISNEKSRGDRSKLPKNNVECSFVSNHDDAHGKSREEYTASSVDNKTESIQPVTGSVDISSGNYSISHNATSLSSVVPTPNVSNHASLSHVDDDAGGSLGHSSMCIDTSLCCSAVKAPASSRARRLSPIAFDRGVCLEGTNRDSRTTSNNNEVAVASRLTNDPTLERTFSGRMSMSYHPAISMIQADPEGSMISTGCRDQSQVSQLHSVTDGVLHECQISMTNPPGAEEYLPDAVSSISLSQSRKSTAEKCPLDKSGYKSSPLSKRFKASSRTSECRSSILPGELHPTLVEPADRMDTETSSSAAQVNTDLSRVVDDRDTESVSGNVDQLQQLSQKNYDSSQYVSDVTEAPVSSPNNMTRTDLLPTHSNMEFSTFGDELRDVSFPDFNETHHQDIIQSFKEMSRDVRIDNSSVCFDETVSMVASLPKLFQLPVVTYSHRQLKQFGAALKRYNSHVDELNHMWQSRIDCDSQF